MIPAQYYGIVFYCILLILLFFKTGKYSKFEESRAQSLSTEPLTSTVLFSIFLFIFIGFRPMSTYFCDMLGYAEAMSLHITKYSPLSWSGEYIYTPIMEFMSIHNFPERAPILFLALVNFCALTLAARKIFPNDTLAAFIVIVGSFTMYSRMVNGIRAGSAIALFLCALAYKDKRYVSVLFLFLSYGFHHSMIMPIVAFLICSVYNNGKLYFYIWIICLIIAALHVQYFQFLFGGLADESGSRYLMASAVDEVSYGGKVGFRIDFIIFSSIPVLIGYYMIFKQDVKSSAYEFILNVYLLTNSVWMLCMYAPYTNRIAEISWGIYPVALIYPFLKEKVMPNQYLIFRKFAFFSIFFSLFMAIRFIS